MFQIVKEKKKAIQDAIDYGIDLSLTDENLALTPEQRAIQHQGALDLLNELLRARKSNTSWAT